MSLEAVNAVSLEVTRGLEETILLVDDDAALLEVTSIVLASEGYRVLTAEDGVEALRILGGRRWTSSCSTSCCRG